MLRGQLWQQDVLNAILSLPAGLKQPQRLTLLLNPQWSTTGQIVSDFG